jgi:hypothetical protein
MAILILGVIVQLALSMIYYGKLFLQNGKVEPIGLLNSLYFSMVTFATIGYGDITPIEGIKLVAAGEGLIGIVLAALFSLTLARRYFV